MLPVQLFSSRHRDLLSPRTWAPSGSFTACDKAKLRSFFFITAKQTVATRFAKHTSCSVGFLQATRVSGRVGVELNMLLGEEEEEREEEVSL